MKCDALSRSMPTISQLRDVGIVDDNGCITDYPNLSTRQRSVVTTKILEILNRCSSDSVLNSDTVRSNIEQYLTMHGASCSFPDFIIRTLMRTYGPDIIDHMIMQED